jgi:hypothetical protein
MVRRRGDRRSGDSKEAQFANYERKMSLEETRDLWMEPGTKGE